MIFKYWCYNLIMALNDQGIDFNRDPSYNLNYQIVLLITKMHDAKLNRDWERYWWAFDSVVKITSIHYTDNTKNMLQEEFNKLKYAEKVIKEKYDNEKTQDNMILELRKFFALQYEEVITQGLKGMDIIKIDIDGVVDFDSYELKNLENAVRSIGSNEKRKEKMESCKEVKTDE